MPDWAELVEDQRGIRAIFGGQAPDLRSISLHELSLDRDGPQLVLRFDLNKFPDTPPRKWQRFNTVQLELSFIGVRDVNIAGWGTEIKTDLRFWRADDGIFVVELEGGGIRVSARALAAMIRKISAYEDTGS